MVGVAMQWWNSTLSTSNMFNWRIITMRITQLVSGHTIQRPVSGSVTAFVMQPLSDVYGTLLFLRVVDGCGDCDPDVLLSLLPPDINIATFPWHSATEAATRGASVAASTTSGPSEQLMYAARGAERQPHLYSVFLKPANAAASVTAASGIPPAAVVEVLGVNLFELTLTAVHERGVAGGDLSAFVLHGRTDITLIRLSVQAVVGVVDVFVSTSPFNPDSNCNPTRAACNYKWHMAAVNATQHLRISATEPNWSPMLYVMVRGVSAENQFRLSAVAAREDDGAHEVSSALFQPDGAGVAQFLGPASDSPMKMAFAVAPTGGEGSSADVKLYAEFRAAEAGVRPTQIAQALHDIDSSGKGMLFDANPGTTLAPAVLVTVGLQQEARASGSRVLKASTKARNDTVLRVQGDGMHKRRLDAAGMAAVGDDMVAVRVWSDVSGWGSPQQCAGNLTACLVVANLASGETRFVAVDADARIETNVVFNSVGVGGSEVKVLVALQLRQPPQDAGTSDTHMTASSGLLSLINCGYDASTLYIAVTHAGWSPESGNVTLSLGRRVCTADQCPSYAWVATAWSACSATCGTGLQARDVSCVDSEGKVVHDGFCHMVEKPEAGQACDNRGCVFATSSYGECSVPCGGGVKFRSVHCRNQDGQGDLVPDAFCGVPPDSSAACGSDACPPAYWTTGPWSACSKPCDTGYQSRTVVCTAGGSPVGAAACADSAPRPPAEQRCNTAACAATQFAMTMFAYQELSAGGSATLRVAADDVEYVSVDVTAPDTVGVCITGTARRDTSDTCSSQQTRNVAACVSEWQACMANNGTTGGAGWDNTDGCACYTSLQGCLAADLCSKAVADLTLAIANKCLAAGACTGAGNGSCLAQPSVHSTDAVSIQLYAAPRPRPVNAKADMPYFTGSPVGVFSSQWATPVLWSSPQKALWIPVNPGATPASLMVGVSSTVKSTATLTATAFASPPASVVADAAHTRVDGTVVFTRQELLDGLVTFRIVLRCGTFVAPTDMILSELNPNKTSFVHGADSVVYAAAPNAKWATLGLNWLLVGLTSATSTGPWGWNQYLKGALLAGNDSVVSLEHGGSVAVVRIPRQAARGSGSYSPSNDDELHVELPDFVLRHGQWMDVPHAKIVIVAEKHECVVSDWGAWGACTTRLNHSAITCAVGVQVRERSVTVYPRGGGAGCPPLSQTRQCNVCNPCSTMKCAHGGVCMGSECKCPVGWQGARCDVPAVNVAGDSFAYGAGEWGVCPLLCGGGTISRRVYCLRCTNATTTTSAASNSHGNNSNSCVEVDMSACKASLPSVSPPDASRACRVVQCSASTVFARVHVELVHSMRAAMFPVAAHDAFDVVLVKELAAALAVPASQLSVIATRQHSGNVSVELLVSPSTASSEVAIAPDSVVFVMQRQLQVRADAGSALSRGSLVPAIVPTSFNFTVVNRDGVAMVTGNLSHPDTGLAAVTGGHGRAWWRVVDEHKIEIALGSVLAVVLAVVASRSLASMRRARVQVSPASAARDVGKDTPPPPLQTTAVVAVGQAGAVASLPSGHAPATAPPPAHATDSASEDAVFVNALSVVPQAHESKALGGEHV